MKNTLREMPKYICKCGCVNENVLDEKAISTIASSVSHLTVV